MEPSLTNLFKALQKYYILLYQTDIVEYQIADLSSLLAQKIGKFALKNKEMQIDQQLTLKSQTNIAARKRQKQKLLQDGMKLRKKPKSEVIDKEVIQTQNLPIMKKINETENTSKLEPKKPISENINLNESINDISFIEAGKSESSMEKQITNLIQGKLVQGVPMVKLSVSHPHTRKKETLTFVLAHHRTSTLSPAAKQTFQRSSSSSITLQVEGTLCQFQAGQQNTLGWQWLTERGARVEFDYRQYKMDVRIDW